MIEVKNLSKSYGSKLAVDGISFTAGESEILGFLGPNGAGKSTTMNMLTGYLSSSGGQALINGVDILEDPVRAKKDIGYLPELPPLYPCPADKYTLISCTTRKSAGFRSAPISMRYAAS